MGAAECCAERKDDPEKKKSLRNNNGATGSGDAPRKSDHAFTSTGKQSVANLSQGADSEKFDKAFDKKDIKTFVELLDSMQPIEAFAERMHPWAQDPKTIGALSGTQLALLSSGSSDNPNVKDEIREAGGITKLVEFLKSDQEDRVQTAIVALNFLTAECPPNAHAVKQAGALPLMLGFLDSPVAGMRAASVTILHHICMEKEEYQTEFADLGGIEALTKQLDTNPNSGLNDADVLLEAVLNIMDLIESPDGNLIQAYAQRAVKAGIVQKLKALSQADDDDLRGAAEDLLADLSKLE